MSGRSLRLFLLAILVVSGTSILLVRFHNDQQLSVGAPGTVDFVQYWSAFRLLNLGQNPYDGEAMHAIQRSVGQSDSFTALMWNPPWTLLLLAPIVSLPFSTAVVVWLLCSIVCLTTIAVLLPAALQLPPPPLFVRGLAVALFYPVAECLALGQILIALTTIFVCCIFVAVRGRFFAAGLLAALLSIKPHLLLMLVPFLVSWLRRGAIQSKWRAVAGFLIGCLLLVASTALAAPHALRWWVESFGDQPTGPGAVSTAEWKTASTITVLRIYLSASDGIPPAWPLFFIPVAAFLILTLWLLYRRDRVTWRDVPPLLCLSLCLGPYGWLYDQTLLIICQAEIIYRWWHQRYEPRLFGALLGLGFIQLIALYLGVATAAPQDAFWWIPWAFLTIWLISGSGSRDPRSDGESPGLAG